MLWRDMRGRTREIHKELQDLDPLCSPHLEEILIGGNIDLDLFSLFPQKDARIMGAKEEGGQACKFNNGGERNPIHSYLKEEEGVFILPKNMTVGATYTAFFWPQTGFFQPRPAFSGQTSGPLTCR
jgi:hypothetical protein